MLGLELPLLYILFLPWCRQILASDMTAQYPPASHLSYVAIFLGILFPCHLSVVFSAMLSFIFLVSLCTSVLRHLAVCNTAESVLCWCFLTTCFSGSFFLSTYSNSFVISSARAYYYYYYYNYNIFNWDKSRVSSAEIKFMRKTKKNGKITKPLKMFYQSLK